MEELLLFSDTHTQLLIAWLEECCQVTLPDKRDDLDVVTFHIYQKKHHQTAHDRRIFQIRWGLHQIFQIKHMQESSIEQTLEEIKTAIFKNGKKIQASLYKYCEQLLSDSVTLRLVPEIDKHSILLSSYKLKICSARKGKNDTDSHGWPNYCVFLSWIDESGDLQQFIYPLHFDGAGKRFDIPTSDIATKFIQYRDSCI